VAATGPVRRCIGDTEAFAASLEAIHLATVEAALRLRGGGQRCDEPVAGPRLPARLDPDSPPSTDAEAMTTVVDETLWRCWQRMIESRRSCARSGTDRGPRARRPST